MITKDYNPSPIEVQFVEVLSELKDVITEKLKTYSVLRVENNTQLDNPTVDFFLTDSDGDEHNIVIKVIQKPDPVGH